MVVRALPWGELEAPMLAVNSASFSLRIAVYLATIGPRSGHDRATIAPRSGHDRAAIGPRSGHDRAAIGPRSRRDRATIVVLAVRRSPSDRLAAITPRQPSDRGSIAPRSRFDRTAIVEFFHDRSAPSDDASGVRMATTARSSGNRFRGASAVRCRSERDPFLRRAFTVR